MPEVARHKNAAVRARLFIASFSERLWLLNYFLDTQREYTSISHRSKNASKFNDEWVGQQILPLRPLDARPDLGKIKSRVRNLVYGVSQCRKPKAAHHILCPITTRD